MKTLFRVGFFVCMMLIASIAWSEIVYVNGTTGDDATGERGNPDKPFKTIQKGIDVAVSGEDTVLVADGTYTGEGNKNLDFKGKAITVTSENGAEQTIIDCEGDGRGFYFHSGETEASVVNGFTITNGSSAIGDDRGGGIFCENSSSPIIKNNIIARNWARWLGGGIYCENSSPTIQNNTITKNGVTLNFSGGGGIYCEKSSSTIQDNLIIDNSAGRRDPDFGGGSGGGIHCLNSSPTIQNNKIIGNSAGGAGGGIYCGISSPTIQNNEIIGNSAASGGGGIYCNNSPPFTIQNNKIIGNSAGDGGGICCSWYCSPTIRNNIITENKATNPFDFYGGGGIRCWWYSSPTIINNTISGNSAQGRGSGINCWGHSSPTVLNTILWDKGREIYVEEGSSITITYSDVRGGWEGEGNIDADPLFVDPDSDDYHLSDYSSCIGAGKMAEGVPTEDIEGNQRPDPQGSNPDMGAYENNRPTPLPRGDVSGNESVTAFDAFLIIRHVVGMINLSKGQQKGADVTGDGNVTALDAALILQYTVGLITQFPLQQGAPIFTVKDENQRLTKIIAELENVSLTTEQEHVLEQLKNLIGQQSIPSHTALLQNYPNPFNPETWLPYRLAQDASVTIRIYNVKGRPIRTLHLGNKNAGVYMTKDKAAHWDGKDSLGQSVASGVYFYTLQVERQRNPDRDGAGTFTATRKMVIVK